jgi:DNA-binding MarR family transcriptional regulator
VERGLIIRSRDKQDRRAKLLEINSAGFTVMESLAVQVDECLYQVAVGTGVEQRELFLKSSKLLAEHQRRLL